jgi:small subunit ribosomal protein S9
VTDETPTPEDETPRDEEQAAEGAAPEAAADAEEPTAAAAEPEPEPEVEEPTAEAEAEEPTAEEPAAEEPTAEGPTLEADEDDEDETPRVKPAIPGADLEVDIVEEGADPLADRDLEAEAAAAEAAAEEEAQQPIATVAIELAADARYRATGKRKTAVARVILKPGTGVYEINGKTLVDYFPRPTLRRQISQPLEAVGFEERIDVVARMHGGGVSAQAGALRHGISRALLEADPNLRGELKKRGFLTRDARAKERKKAGLKKARKRPQFSKR